MSTKIADMFDEGLAEKFNPEQARDEKGRWTSGGGAPDTSMGTDEHKYVAALSKEKAQHEKAASRHNNEANKAKARGDKTAEQSHRSEAARRSDAAKQINDFLESQGLAANKGDKNDRIADDFDQGLAEKFSEDQARDAYGR